MFKSRGDLIDFLESRGREFSSNATVPVELVVSGEDWHLVMRQAIVSFSGTRYVRGFVLLDGEITEAVGPSGAADLWLAYERSGVLASVAGVRGDSVIEYTPPESGWGVWTGYGLAHSADGPILYWNSGTHCHATTFNESTSTWEEVPISKSDLSLSLRFLSRGKDGSLIALLQDTKFLAPCDGYQPPMASKAVLQTQPVDRGPITSTSVRVPWLSEIVRENGSILGRTISNQLVRLAPSRSADVISAPGECLAIAAEAGVVAGLFVTGSIAILKGDEWEYATNWPRSRQWLEPLSSHLSASSGSFYLATAEPDARGGLLGTKAWINTGAEWTEVFSWPTDLVPPKRSVTSRGAPAVVRRELNLDLFRTETIRLQGDRLPITLEKAGSVSTCLACDSGMVMLVPKEGTWILDSRGELRHANKSIGHHGGACWFDRPERLAILSARKNEILVELASPDLSEYRRITYPIQVDSRWGSGIVLWSARSEGFWAAFTEPRTAVLGRENLGLLRFSDTGEILQHHLLEIGGSVGLRGVEACSDVVIVAGRTRSGGSLEGLLVALEPGGSVAWVRSLATDGDVYCRGIARWSDSEAVAALLIGYRPSGGCRRREYRSFPGDGHTDRRYALCGRYEPQVMR